MILVCFNGFLCLEVRHQYVYVILLLICIILLFFERSLFAFKSCLARFDALHKALGFSLYHYFTVYCPLQFSEYCGKVPQIVKQFEQYFWFYAQILVFVSTTHGGGFALFL